MRVAVLGGTRFIGPHLVRSLLEKGHQVEVCHRGKTHGPLPAGVRHVTVDRDIRGQVAEALAHTRPNAVIDMCGYRAQQLEEITRANLGLVHYIFCSTTAV